MKINDKELKFNIGDTVYFMHVGFSEKEEVFSSKILGILIKENNSFFYLIKYNIFDDGYIEENRLYATEEEAEEKLKKSKIKVYLSGAIANDKDYISKFMTAKEEVKKMGFFVLNPIETDESMHDNGAKECMFASIELLRQADVLLLLDNPETIESRGMQIEKAMARYCDIPIVSDYIELDRFYNYKFKENKKENKPYEEQEE